MTGQDNQELGVAAAAAALVAACRRVGLSPLDAYRDDRKAGRARRIAGAGCMAHLGVSARSAGAVFQVKPNRLAPTKLKSASIEAEDLAAVARALDEAGLGGRSPRPVARVPVATATSGPDWRSVRRQRWMRQFIASGAWTFEEVADLFDTTPKAVAAALSPRGSGQVQEAA